MEAGDCSSRRRASEPACDRTGILAHPVNDNITIVLSLLA